MTTLSMYRSSVFALGVVAALGVLAPTALAQTDPVYVTTTTTTAPQQIPAAPAAAPSATIATTTTSTTVAFAVAGVVVTAPPVTTPPTVPAAAPADAGDTEVAGLEVSFTGIDAAPMVATGGALAVGGALLVVSARRRKQSAR